jgi:hypothetical protein
MIRLRLTFLSDTCFSSTRRTLIQDVDTCQDLDELGLPQVGGRVLEGLMVEECNALIRALEEANPSEAVTWKEIAEAVFGSPAAAFPSLLRIGNAHWNDVERAALRDAQDPCLLPLTIRATTVVRRQTKITDLGTAEEHSLRAARLARKGTVLYAPITYNGRNLVDAPEKNRALIAACLNLMRRGGLHRSRGWGRLRCELVESDAGVISGWEKPVLNALSDRRA